jgi:hypothetical protein
MNKKRTMFRFSSVSPTIGAAILNTALSGSKSCLVGGGGGGGGGGGATV